MSVCGPDHGQFEGACPVCYPKQATIASLRGRHPPKGIWCRKTGVRAELAKNDKGVAISIRCAPCKVVLLNADGVSWLDHFTWIGGAGSNE